MRWLLLLVLCSLLAWDGSARLPLLRTDAPITATRVVLMPDAPWRARVGGLVFLGGLRLRSPDPAFGGFSAMTVVGDRITLLNDGGNYLRFRLGSDWTLHAITLGALPAGPKNGWHKSDRDSESLTRGPDGQLWAGFENANQIWRYAPDFARATGHVAPEAMRRWSANGGPEAMVRLHDGSFLVFSESSHWPHAKALGDAALWFDRDPVAPEARHFRFTLRPPPGEDVSDAAELPDGRILVLSRRVALPFDFPSTLTVIDRRTIRPGATVVGQAIAHFDGPVTHDNFEALAVTQEGAATILWLASDDNQSVLQQSLLMKFRLDDSR